MATKKPATSTAKAKPRRAAKEGGLYKRTGYRIDPDTGERVAYTFWQATREIPSNKVKGGKTRHRVTGNGPTKAVALARVNENYAKYFSPEADERRLKTAARSAAGPTAKNVADLFEGWNEANHADRVSDIMARKYERLWKNHLEEHLANIPIQDVTPAMLRHLVSGVLAEKRKTKTAIIDGITTTITLDEPLMKLSALNNVKTALSAMFTWGIENNFCIYNPARGVKLRTASTQNEDLTDFMKRADELIRTLERDNDPDYCRWLFQFLGMRRAERLGLTWENVKGLDTNNARIIIDRQLARKAYNDKKRGGWYLKEKTKNEQARTIALVGPFLTALRQHKAAQDKLKKLDTWKPEPAFADLVFLRPNGAMITLNGDNDDWHAVLERHDFGYWRGHLNRHITATRLAEIEPPVPTAIIESILGHRTEALKKYYVHRTAVEQTTSMQRYSELLSQRSNQAADDIDE